MYTRTSFLKRGVFLRKELVQIFHLHWFFLVDRYCDVTLLLHRSQNLQIFMLENKIFAQIIKKRFLQKYNLTF